MGRTENQKLKLLYLKELFERQSDEEHLLSMQDILDALAAQGIRAELTLPLPTRPFPIETTVEFRSQPSHPDEHSTTALQHQLRRELYLLTRRHSGN